MTEETSAPTLLELATELTTAWLANPNTRVSADEVPAFLEKMHATVSGLSSRSSQQEEAPAAPEYTPAVSVRRSLASKEHLISLIDGKPYKTLKRHLSTNGLTPAQYRERYNLKSDYPMVAENYAEMRRGLAKKIGLGRKPGEKPAAKNGGATPAKTQDTAPTAKTGAKPAAKPAGKVTAKAAAKPKSAPAAKAVPAPIPKKASKAKTAKASADQVPAANMPAAATAPQA